MPGYWPPERPAIYFKEVDADADYLRSALDPRVLVPLYQAVFHGSVVATDRWELSPVKIRNAGRVRAHRFFSAVHREVGGDPMTAFEWLTSEHDVQRATYGNAIAVTANFSDADAAGVAAGCAEARWLDGSRVETWCPPQ